MWIAGEAQPDTSLLNGKKKLVEIVEDIFSKNLKKIITITVWLI